jgi:hypothetical protein
MHIGKAVVSTSSWLGQLSDLTGPLLVYLFHDTINVCIR